MKTILTSLAAALCGLVSCTAQTTEFKSLSVDEFEKTISDASIVRLDVRTPQEYAEGHIVSAINIDVQSDDFDTQASATLPKDKTIAVYCRSGRRSKMAAQRLVKMGYEVAELNTGFIGWQQAAKGVTTEEVDLFVSPAGTCVYSYCIKHGTLRLRVGEKWIYVDPVTDKIPPVTDYTVLPKADIILITHEHPDHLDAKAISQLTKEGTVIVTNPRSSEILAQSLPDAKSLKEAVVLQNGDTREVAGISIEAVAAYNSSADKQQFHPKGRDNGYVLTLGSSGQGRGDGLRFYIAGDTEDIPELADVKDIDVAFLPCNLPFTMTPEQLGKAARMVRPKVLFPYHYGQTSVESMLQALEGAGIDVRIRQYQ